MNLTLAEVARCLGTLADEGFEKTVVTEVKTDSRTVEPGDLFFCIAGENFDGHEFAEQAARSGACAVVASRMIGEVDAPILMVRDTQAALGRLAACWRDTCGARLVAVTGTAGKTTVKEMLAQPWSSQKFNPLPRTTAISTIRSDCPCPCSRQPWSRISGSWSWASRRQGDMEELAPIASPDLADHHQCWPRPS